MIGPRRVTAGGARQATIHTSIASAEALQGATETLGLTTSLGGGGVGCRLSPIDGMVKSCCACHGGKQVQIGLLTHIVYAIPCKLTRFFLSHGCSKQVVSWRRILPTKGLRGPTTAL